MPAQVHLVNREWTVLMEQDNPLDWSEVYMDDQGNSFVTSSRLISATQVNLTLSKIDNSGNTVWQTTLGAAGQHHYGIAIDVDGSGHIYVAGTRASINTSGGPGAITLENFDFVLAKFAPTGTKIWDFAWDRGLSEDDIPADLAGDLEVELVDLAGHPIQLFPQQAIPSGRTAIPIDVADLPPGIYFFRVRIADQQSVVKFVKL